MTATSKILSGLFFCLGFLPAGAQYSNSLESFSLRGKVKTISSSEWVVKENAGQIAKVRSSLQQMFSKDYLVKFNRSGNILSNTPLDSNNVNAVQTVYTYNDAQQLVLSTRISRDTSIKTSFTYLREDSVETVYESGQDQKKRIWQKKKFNKKGLVTEIIYPLDAGQENKHLFIYDDKGNLTRYNIEVRGAPLVQMTYSYQNGKKASGQSVFYSDNKKTSETTVTYNLQEDASKEVIADYALQSKKSTRLYEYNYDQQGNWTTRKTFELINGEKKLVLLAERTITYYE